MKITTYALLINKLRTELSVLINGLKTISKIKKGDKILFAEGCGEHPQNNCKFKIKEWLYSRYQKDLDFKFIKDEDLPEKLTDYKLLVHCDGCKLLKNEIQSRINQAVLMDVPIVSYGIVTAYMNDALTRSLKPLGIKIT